MFDTLKNKCLDLFHPLKEKDVFVFQIRNNDSVTKKIVHEIMRKIDARYEIISLNLEDGKTTKIKYFDDSSWSMREDYFSLVAIKIPRKRGNKVSYKEMLSHTGIIYRFWCYYEETVDAFGKTVHVLKDASSYGSIHHYVVSDVGNKTLDEFIQRHRNRNLIGRI